MSGDILDLIDNAIGAYEVSADAMRWTPEAPEDEVDSITGMRIGGFVRDTGWSMVDETHCWDTATWQDITEHVRNLPTNITRVWLAGTTAVTFTLDNRDATFRRAHLNDEVPSGLGREYNDGSSERTTQ